METIQVDNLNHETTCKAIKKGCHNTRFMESLIKNPIRDYHQLMKRAHKYIHLDDKKQAQKAEMREEKKFRDRRGHLKTGEGGT